MADKIVVTPETINEALGNSAFKLSFTERERLAKALTLKINPPVWRVDEDEDVDGDTVPVIRYIDGLHVLWVYGDLYSRTGREKARHTAELVAGVLNERELVIA